MIKKIDVFYRGVKAPKFNWPKSWKIKLAFIWRLVALKWIDNLIEWLQMIKSEDNQKIDLKNLELVIIWDWEEMNRLRKLAKWLNVKFLWFKDRDFIIDFLQKNNVIVINPSFQEWLPTIVIEWLLTWNIVVASDVWGTKEISDKEDLILFEAGNNKDLKEKLVYALENFHNLAGLSKESVGKKFSWDGNIERLYELLK
jgi:hypothetical protein